MHAANSLASCGMPLDLVCVALSVLLLLRTGLALCSFISFIMNGPAALLTNLADLDVVPPFDKPWLSTSLADFWSRCA